MIALLLFVYVSTEFSTVYDIFSPNLFKKYIFRIYNIMSVFH